VCFVNDLDEMGGNAFGPHISEKVSTYNIVEVPLASYGRPFLGVEGGKGVLVFDQQDRWILSPVQSFGLSLLKHFNLFQTLFPRLEKYAYIICLRRINVNTKPEHPSISK
jgi:hypothetical protein